LAGVGRVTKNGAGAPIAGGREVHERHKPLDLFSMLGRLDTFLHRCVPKAALQAGRGSTS